MVRTAKDGNNVDFIYIYKHGAKVIKFDLRLWVFYFNDVYFIKGEQRAIIDFLNTLSGNLKFVIHNSSYDQLLKEKFNLEPKIIAYQYSYLKKYVTISTEIKIKPVFRSFYIKYGEKNTGSQFVTQYFLILFFA